MDSAGEAVRADVGLAGDRIVAVGDLSKAVAANEFAADGLLVCPGFIDVHTHSDAYLLIEPGAPSKIRQGVTTEITGNCGASAAPRWPGYTMPSDWLEQTYPGDWHSVAEYRALLDAQKPAVNSAMLIGHRAIRAAVMGIAPRAATKDEIAQMEVLLDAALAEGGAGLSTGLVYAPAMHAQPEEITALAKVVARRGGIYATHMRSEGGTLLEAIDEALDVARASGVRLQISHLKTAGRANWHKLDAALEKIRAAQTRGHRGGVGPLPLHGLLHGSGCDSADLGRRRAAARRFWRGCAIRRNARKSARKWRRRATTSIGKRVWIGSTRHPDNAAFAGKPIARGGGSVEAASAGCGAAVHGDGRAVHRRHLLRDERRQHVAHPGRAMGDDRLRRVDPRAVGAAEPRPSASARLWHLRAVHAGRAGWEERVRWARPCAR